MSDVTRVPDGVASDAELITAVRQGDTAAFGVLYQRHEEAARRVAQRYVPAADADDVVAGAFEKILQVLRGGKGPDVAFRAYLFTVVRRRAIESLEKARRTTATDDVAVFDSVIGPLASTEEPMLRGFEDRTVARAFESLPERWRTVLWYLDIEQQTPAAVAPALGMSANGVSALAYRAREGLRQAYLQEHLLSPAVSEDCRVVNDQLGSYARGGLSRRETTRVEAHLDVCAACRAAALELGDLAQGMRAVVAPLILGTLGVASLGLLPVGGAAPAAAAAAAGAGAGSEGIVVARADAGVVATGGGPGAPLAVAVPGGASAVPAVGLISAIAQLPAAVLAAAGVVVVGGLVAAGVALASGSNQVAPGVAGPLGTESVAEVPTVAPPTVVTPDSPVEETPTADPTSVATPPDLPTGPGETPAPSTTPDDPTGDEPDEDPEPSEPAPTDEPSGAPTATPSENPSREPTAAPTSAPTSAPAPTPTHSPTPTPSPTPTATAAPVAPAALNLAISQVKASGMSTVTLSVANTAQLPATEVEVELTLPAGMYVSSTGVILAASQPAQTLSAMVAAAISPSWSCSTTTSSAVCAVPDIPAGAETSTTFQVTLKTPGVSRLDVEARVTTAGGSATRTVPVAVEAAAAEVQARVLEDSLLVVDGTGVVSVEVTNAGEVATPAVVRVELPDGAEWLDGRDGGHVPGSAEGWLCALYPATARTLECRTDDLPGGLADPQRLDLPATTSAAELGAGVLSWGPSTESLTSEPYLLAGPVGAVLRPEALVLTRIGPYAPTDVGTLGVDVFSNGRAASGATVVVELPDGVVLEGVPTIGEEACQVESNVVTCALPGSAGSEARVSVPVSGVAAQGAGVSVVPVRAELATSAGTVVLAAVDATIEVLEAPTEVPS